MRVLQIGADRSRRGILFPGTPATARQVAYAKRFGHLDIIGFSRASDGAKEFTEAHLSVHPTNSSSRFAYGRDAMRIAKTVPKPDVVSAQDPFESGLAALLIARALRVPLHVQVHTDFLSPGYARHSLFNRTRVLLAGYVLRRAARVRVVSESIKEKMEKRYHLAVPVTALPLYFDATRFAEAPHDPELEQKFEPFKWKVLYVGRFEAEKNVGLAIESLAKAAPKDACLILLGRGSAGEGLQALARTLHIADRVFFEGEHDPAPYYKLASLLLLTSHYEGYPGVVAEALSAGVPVLSTDAGAAREIGAIVALEGHFADALQKWFETGERKGVLKSRPYKDSDEYVQAYCDDVAASLTQR